LNLKILILVCATLFLAILFAACHGESTPEIEVEKLQDIDSYVTSEGYKNVQFGMTADEAIAAYDGDLMRPEFISEEYENCFYLTPNESPEITFMVLSGLVQRIDIDSPEILTETGAGIGMSFQDVESLYPGTARKTNFYTYPLQDLIATLSDKTRAIFEQDDDGMIYTYRVGLLPAVELVEGCL